MSEFDKRRHSRDDTISAVQYVLNRLHSEEIFDGVIANISESGVCLLTTDPLNKGQDITIKNKIPATSQTATVRWSSKYHNLYYMAGLELI
jgi:hypothetical protein